MGTGEPRRPLLRVGHKGADAVVPGNTIASFEAAAEIGVDVIEFDVLRPRSDFGEAGDWRAADAGPVTGDADPLIVAHDWGAAARGEAPTLAEVLDAFTEAPLDGVQIDLDLKIAGREDEVIAGLRERGLTERAMVSTMEVPSVECVRTLAPELRAGWTIPRATRAWDRKRWARPALLGAVAAMRRRLPSLVAKRAPVLGVWAVWVYHPLVTARLARACHEAGVELIAWTVDDLERMRELAEMGVGGIVTNDARLLAQLDPATTSVQPLKGLSR